jgi:hypothetical protein
MLKCLSAIFALLSLSDLLFTIYLIKFYGQNIEGNPIASFCYEMGGLFLIGCLKFASVLVVLVISCYVSKRRWSYSLFLLGFGCVIMLLTVGYSLTLACETFDDRSLEYYQLSSWRRGS